MMMKEMDGLKQGMKWRQFATYVLPIGLLLISGESVSCLFLWSQRADLNRGPTDYESVALPTELRWPW
jgi:hypothetical protein